MSGWSPNICGMNARQIDLDTKSSGLSLEAERRLGQSYKAILEARFQGKVGDNDKLAQANVDEDFIRLRLAYFF